MPACASRPSRRPYQVGSGRSCRSMASCSSSEQGSKRRAFRESGTYMNNLRAYPVYLCIRGAFALFFTLWATVAMVYRIEVVDLDPLRLVLLGTALEISVFLFEVPPGVLADTS